MPREIDMERVLCSLADLAGGASRGFTLGGAGGGAGGGGGGEGDWPLRGLVVQARAGVVRAFLNWCPHAGHPLNLKPHGFLSPDGALLLCHSHGALFEKEGGLCVAGPCAGRSLRAIPIEVEAGLVLLTEGVEPAALQAAVDVSRR
jgi:nitrite reductase/ring-hydroxylating ferredoxin subunit